MWPRCTAQILIKWIPALEVYVYKLFAPAILTSPGGVSSNAKKKAKRGNGYWKINNSILHDVNYITQIKRVISDFVEINAQKDTSPHTSWETLKCVFELKPSNFVLGKKKA